MKSGINSRVQKENVRARRNRRRKRVVFFEKLIIVCICVAALAGGGIAIYNLIPQIRVAQQLEEADELIETENYEDAIASCEEALKIDSTSVQAYRTMAGAYLTQEEMASAEQILYQGWETTQDESLLQYYCTVLLNEAVADINNQCCTLNTLDKCISVLEKDYDNADAFRLLDVCYERLFEENPEQEGLLCNTMVEGTCGFKVYQELMLRMMLVYEANPTEELLAQISRFAAPGSEVFWLDVEHLDEYEELLQRIAVYAQDDAANRLMACTQKACEVLAFFEEAFGIFESGEFEPIKNFMNSEEYIAIRDSFIEGNMEYWQGQTYIPVSREKIKFVKDESGWKFAFANYEEYEDTAGVINVWGAKQEDAGVQRLCISYEPAGEEYYPHTTYEFIYLYSNVQIGNQYVPQMNYRFETRVATPEGTTTYLVGDWGGEHEWNAEF